MRDLKLFNVSTVAGQKITLEFAYRGTKFIVVNRSGGMIYVNMSDSVNETNGFPVADGEVYIMVENENIAQFDSYSNVVSILPMNTSNLGVTVQMVDYWR